MTNATNLKTGETIEALRGMPHLCNGGSARVYANRTQADAAAARTGGEAYQSIASARFLVRFPKVELIVTLTGNGCRTAYPDTAEGRAMVAAHVSGYALDGKAFTVTKE